MRTICELDEIGFWTGETDEIADEADIPAGWVVIDPPDDLPEGWLARHNGFGGWVLFDTNAGVPVPEPARRTICELDAAGLWSGATRAIGVMDALPIGWVEVEPPADLPEGDTATFNIVDGWIPVSAADAQAIREAASPAPTFDDHKAAKLDAVNAHVSFELALGAPVVVSEGVTLHVALDDGSRADLTAMGTTALAAASSATPWPESYQQGWITKENVRIPLATPQEALGLAAMVGDRYAQIRQHGRDLKDLVLAAEDEEDLDSIDITQGWPT